MVDYTASSAMAIYQQWLSDPVAQREFERRLDKLFEKTDHLMDPMRASERLTAEDLAVFVNT